MKKIIKIMLPIVILTLFTGITVYAATSTKTKTINYTVKNKAYSVTVPASDEDMINAALRAARAIDAGLYNEEHVKEQILSGNSIIAGNSHYTKRPDIESERKAIEVLQSFGYLEDFFGE